MNYPVWLPMTMLDMAIADDIGGIIHPNLPERYEVFVEKLALFPQGHYKLMMDGEMVGYASAVPYVLGRFPDLDTFIGELPKDANTMHIYDVAILPKARGFNSTGKYVDIMEAVAQSIHLSHMSLVSVYGTDSLWSRFGFQEVSHDELSHYGDKGVKYMTMDIAFPPFSGCPRGDSGPVGCVSRRQKRCTR